MSRLAAAIGGGSFVLVTLVVGLRLILLARRTRQLPELAIGLGLLLMGGLAYPMIATARQAEALSEPARSGIMMVGHVLLMTGAVAVAVFNQRVFQPRSRAMAFAPWILTAALISAFGIQCVTPGYRAAALESRGIALVVVTACMALVLGWSAFESLTLAARMRRRLSLGLADPLIVDRLRLWGIATVSATAISVFTLGCHLRGIEPATSTLGALVIGPLGLVASGSMWLAFLPPESYRRRVARAAP